MEVHTVGVIGAGQMGAGIAQVTAQAGIPVLMYDVAPEACKRGLDSIRKNFDRMIQRAGAKERVLPGHDMLIFSRFPTEGRIAKIK